MNIQELAKKYSLTKDDAWNCHGNWIVSHNAIEKIAVQEQIQVKDIIILNSEENLVRLIVVALKGTVEVKTIGEADRKNCKSQYLGCMAEKRGIDRAVLKLINAYQYGIYSDVEADEFSRKKQGEH
jgi:hypothetical protein